MRLVGKNEIPPPRSVFSANTHLGGRVQRPLVLFLYPRVGMHEFILLLHPFLSFWYHSRTWGGGLRALPSMWGSPVCSYYRMPYVTRLLTSVTLLLLLHLLIVIFILFPLLLLSSSFLVPSSHSPTSQASCDQLQPVEARVRRVLTFLQGSTIASCLMMGPRNYNPGGQPSL
jgi:hypothetical protein